MMGPDIDNDMETQQWRATTSKGAEEVQEDGAVEDGGSSSLAHRRLAPGWMTEEKFALVAAAGCEGFIRDPRQVGHLLGSYYRL